MKQEQIILFIILSMSFIFYVFSNAEEHEAVFNNFSESYCVGSSCTNNIFKRMNNMNFTINNPTDISKYNFTLNFSLQKIVI